MQPATKSDGSPVYEYVLLYTDDVLVVSENGKRVLREESGCYFELKEESIGPPKLYLGGHVQMVELENGATKGWAFSSLQYVQTAVKNVEEYLTSKGIKLPATAETPLRTNYRPAIDVLPKPCLVNAVYYQSLIGILRWMVELVCVDI
jgi:hypothetical protein